MIKILNLAFILFFALSLSAQRYENGQLIYGNEWIDYDKEYVKFRLAEDGIYRIDYSSLLAWGLPIDSEPLSKLQLWVYGKEIPIYTSTDGIAGADDFIYFYGRKNRSEVDRLVHETDDLIFNTEYSMVTDTTSYFITVNNGTNLRYQNILAEDVVSVNTQNYILTSQKKVFNKYFHKPYINSEKVSYSQFLPGEGFADRRRANTNFTVALPNYYAEGPKKEASIRLALNYADHDLEVQCNGETIYTKTGTRGLDLINHTTAIDDDKNEVKFSISSSDDNDRHSVSVGEVIYPRDLDMDGVSYLEFSLEPSSTARKVEFLNTQEDILLFNTTTNEFITLYTGDDGRKGFIQEAGSDTENFVFISKSSIKPITNGSRKSFKDYTSETGNYVMISNTQLYQNSDIMQRYMVYRSSEKGGNYNPVLVDVNELYDQFAYGIDGHFAALKQFGLFMRDNWGVKMVYLIGKGIQYSNYRSAAQKATGKNLIPTFGSPGADMPLFTDFGDLVPYFAIGRLAANTTEEIELYLNKLKEHDASRDAAQSIEDKYWMKRVLHMSGGSSKDYSSVASHLKSMEEVIDTTMVGAEVSTVYKYSDETVSEAFSNITLDRINAGVNILTFFGHASVSTTDFRLANPANWENRGRYPLVISYGCYSGNCHTDGFAISEDYVFQEEKGGIAFLGTSGAAYGSHQAVFGRRLYYNYGTDFYGGSLGETIHRSLMDLKDATSDGRRTFMQQIIFHGDPAIVLPYSEGTDLTWEGSNTQIKPDNPNALDETATVCADLLNIGKYIGRDSTQVSLRHFNASNTLVLDSTYTVDVPSSRNEVCFDLSLKDETLVGKNRIELTVNPEYTLEEKPSPEAQGNNVLTSQSGVVGYEFNVLSDAAIATYPYNYGIVNETEVKLIATTYNAFADSASYIMELDTTPLFNSPYKQNTRLVSRSPIEWTTNVMDETDRVYYWRVAPDTLGGAEGAAPAWDESSFTYISGDVQGWSQGHWGQFDDGKPEGLSITDGKYYFDKYILNANVFNSNKLESNIFIDGTEWDEWRFSVPSGIAVIVCDSLNGELWQNPTGTGGLYGSVNKFTFPGAWLHYFEYPADTPENMDSLMNFIENIIPNGNTIILNSLSRNNKGYPIDFWKEEESKDRGIFKKLEEIGFTDYKNLRDDGQQPFIYVYRKGKLHTIVEEVSQSDPSEPGIEASFTYKGTLKQAILESKPIGPSYFWKDVNINPVQNVEDTLRVNIIGITRNGEEEVLLSGIEESSDISFINANKYPYIKTQAVIIDNKSRTPLMTKFIRVSHIPKPDILLSSPFVNKLQELRQGEKLDIPINVINLSANNVDELIDIEFKVQSSNNIYNQETRLNLDGLEGKTIRKVKFDLDVENLDGLYNLQVEVNSSRSALEPKYENNYGRGAVKVIREKVAPIVDVFFDGRAILNEEIVSSKPKVKIVLKDENSIKLLTDPNSIKALLKYPNNETYEVDNSTEGYLFIPARNSSSNETVLEFEKYLDQEGIYELKVTGKDASGNDTESVVKFQVIHKEMVNNFYNYPNPFSSNTQFVFTLTGKELPSSVIIRIYTTSGKVVREITGDQLGDLRIGTNISDYKWNGTDEYGNKLANGVYFYKVSVKNSMDNDYELLDIESQQKHFNEGFGKLVIMR